MNTFPLTLLNSRGADRFDAVRQFVCADATGSFGILAGHADMTAVLRYGLVRFVDDSWRWRYASLPGGVLRFAGGRLHVATVQYFLGEERGAIIRQLEAELAREDSDVRTARATLAEIEHSLLRRLGQLSGSAPVTAA